MELVAHQVARPLVFADLFSQNIACSFQCIFLVFDFSFDEVPYLGGKVVFLLHHEQEGQRFQSFGTCSFGSGFSFGLEGKVDVFQFGCIPASRNAGFQLWSQFPLLLDGGKYGFLSFGQFTQFLIPCLNVAYLHFIQSAGSFFTVTADERNGRSSLEQFECIGYAMCRQFQFGGNHLAEFFH